MNWPNNFDCGTCGALWHQLSRRRYGPGLEGWEGLHSDVRSVRAHAVRWRTTYARHAHVWAHGEAFCVQRELGWAALSARSARWGSVSASLSHAVVVGRDECVRRR